MDIPLPKVTLDMYDALYLPPILTAYGTWIQGVCPFQNVLDVRIATIASLQQKLSVVQEHPEEKIDRIMVPVTFEEVEVLKNSLALFLGQAPRLLPASRDLRTLILHCDNMLVKISTTFS